MNSAGDSFFRADTMVLRSPNLFLKILFETNITAAGQDALNATLTTDSDMNGFVDTSLVLRFVNTKTPSMTNAQLTPGGALCPLPIDPARACGPDATFPFYAPAVDYANGQSCPLLGTQEMAAGSCFASTPASIVIQLPILGAVPLQDGQVIGSWDGTGISNGRVRGFLPKTVAAVTKLGDGLPEAFALVGIAKGAPLTDFLSDRELSKRRARRRRLVVFGQLQREADLVRSEHRSERADRPGGFHAGTALRVKAPSHASDRARTKRMGDLARATEFARTRNRALPICSRAEPRASTLSEAQRASRRSSRASGRSGAPTAAICARSRCARRAAWRASRAWSACMRTTCAWRASRRWSSACKCSPRARAPSRSKCG